MPVRTNEELGEALKREDSTIEIEGDLANKVIKIKATGQAAWLVAIGAIGVAVVAIITTAGTGGSASPVSVPAGASGLIAATAVIGTEATMMAIAVAVAAGGVGALTRLYSGYQIAQKGDGRVVLVKT